MNNSEEIGKKFCELLDIIARLRGPGGCPWDQKQTVQSFKPYLIEETYELSEALDNDDPGQISEELGDLLFQIGFIDQLYEEKNLFSMDEVLQAIIDKMIRRHPHVFEGKTFASYEEMRKNWARVKEGEKAEKKSNACELDLPKSMPALSRAQKVAGRAARSGFLSPELPSLAERLSDQAGVMARHVRSGNSPETERSIGEMLFLVAQIAGKTDANSEQCLHSATSRFIRHFKTMEEILADQGLAMGELDRESQRIFWEKASENDEQ